MPRRLSPTPSIYLQMVSLVAKIRTLMLCRHAVAKCGTMTYDDSKLDSFLQQCLRAIHYVKSNGSIFIQFCTASSGNKR